MGPIVRKNMHSVPQCESNSMGDKAKFDSKPTSNMRILKTMLSRSRQRIFDVTVHRLDGIEARTMARNNDSTRR
jgi:hypothetical protein